MATGSTVMRHIPEPILIFSVYQEFETKEGNELAHYAAMSVLQGARHDHIELDGCYNGTTEKSILVEGWKARGLVETLCHRYKQQCYLESHGDRFTTLVYLDGRRENIGYLVYVSEIEAKQNKSWSYNPISGYFITKASRV